MRTATSSHEGVLLVDKAGGMTSHDVVREARRALGESRIGHAGTLDPFATGLLVLLVGRATRLLPYLDAEPKVYDVRMRFGAETDTDDLTGEVTRTAAPPTPAAVESAIAALTGDIEQTPPTYSAKQVGGERAHAAARRGRALTLAPARVQVHAWTERRLDDGELDCRITCSGGTYVRALARDLGRLVGSAAHVTSLRRVRSGSFAVADAISLEELRAGRADVRPPRTAVASLATELLDDTALRRVLHGLPVPATASGAHAALLDQAGSLVAVAERCGAVWQPRVVLRDA
jgi:tRNA pseudouridine55 synthase